MYYVSCIKLLVTKQLEKTCCARFIHLFYSHPVTIQFSFSLSKCRPFWSLNNAVIVCNCLLPDSCYISCCVQSSMLMFSPTQAVHWLAEKIPKPWAVKTNINYFIAFFVSQFFYLIRKRSLDAVLQDSVNDRTQKPFLVNTFTRIC